MSPVTTIGVESDPAKRLRTTWGGNVSKFRRLRGMSQLALANEIGVSQQAVARWESGKSAPRWHHQAAIAKAFDAPHVAIFPMPEGV